MSQHDGHEFALVQRRQGYGKETICEGTSLEEIREIIEAKQGGR